MSDESHDPIAGIESSVRGYARLFPTIFQSASGSILTDTRGVEFIDFFCGAGSLNYGHNNVRAKDALLRYIQADGIQHSLDTVTQSKVDFLSALDRIILRPRGMDYRVQFTGPTGTNAVEAAIKLARKHKRRSHIVAFTNAYHGHSLGSLALTANEYYHCEFYGSRNNVTHLPFDGYLGDQDTSVLLAKMLEDPSSGLPKPAAIVLETIQGEGGVNVASDRWLSDVAEICKRNDVLLIVDDIQVGNGRSGKFFSFEHANIEPDIVCISKSIGGGLPMSLVLLRPECDAWRPGEHTGTFRGNNLAFVAAAAVLSHWSDPGFEDEIARRGSIVQKRLEMICDAHPQLGMRVRGRGLIWGLDVQQTDIANRVIEQAFTNGLLIESSGARNQVLKLMPALIIPIALLEHGLSVLRNAIETVVYAPSSPITVPVVADNQVIDLPTLI